MEDEVKNKEDDFWNKGEDSEGAMSDDDHKQPQKQPRQLDEEDRFELE